MSDIEYSEDFYGVVKKPNLFTEAERVAKIRELQRRERKEKLYSYFPEKSSSL